MEKSKAYKGMAMEGPIASWYAKNTLKDIKRHKLMAGVMARHIPQNGAVLEVAPGPGYFCVELAKLGDYRITGLDISQSFVDIAHEYAGENGYNIDFRLGDAANMPFGDGQFDFVFCQAAFKNFTHPVKAIAEMYRVLKPGGKAVISDLRRDASLAGIDEEIEGMQLNWINRVLTRWTFQTTLLKNAYNGDEMQRMASATPFGGCRVELNGIGFQAWFEK